jgi:DegV family protein with EDD domain
VDSRNLSTGIGHLVLDAAEMAEQGMDAADIASALEKKREKLDVSFVIDTLEYLKRGGRCSALVAMSANLLHLKPCIEVKDGKMGVGHKYRGKLEKCYVQYIEERLKGRDDIDCHRIFITDSGCDEATWRELERVVRACQPFEEVIHTRAGCTVSNHCGPGCMGILYYHK